MTPAESPAERRRRLARERQRRKRRLKGVRVYRLPLPDADVEAALTEAGLLDPATDDHAKIEGALTQAVLALILSRHA